jgi:hypothetical protein
MGAVAPHRQGGLRQRPPNARNPVQTGQMQLRLVRQSAFGGTCPQVRYQGWTSPPRTSLRHSPQPPAVPNCTTSTVLSAPAAPMHHGDAAVPTQLGSCTGHDGDNECKQTLPQPEYQPAVQGTAQCQHVRESPHLCHLQAPHSHRAQHPIKEDGCPYLGEGAAWHLAHTTAVQLLHTRRVGACLGQSLAACASHAWAHPRCASALQEAVPMEPTQSQGHPYTQLHRVVSTNTRVCPQCTTLIHSSRPATAMHKSWS